MHFCNKKAIKINTNRGEYLLAYGTIPVKECEIKKIQNSSRIKSGIILSKTELCNAL